MRFIPSLLIYNPLEAMVLIMLCDTLVNRKRKLTDIFHYYMFGIINLVIQFSASNVSIDSYKVILNLVLAFVVLPIELCIYYNKAVVKSKEYNISMLMCIFISLIYLVEIMALDILIEPFVGNVLCLIKDSAYLEFANNIFIKFIQVCTIFILKVWRSNYD